MNTILNSIGNTPALEILDYWLTTQFERMERRTAVCSQTMISKLKRAFRMQDLITDLDADKAIDALGARSKGGSLLKTSAALNMSRFCVFLRWLVDAVRTQADRRRAQSNDPMNDYVELGQWDAIISYVQNLEAKVRKVMPSIGASRPPRTLTEDQVRLVIGAGSPHSRPVIALLAITGLRVGEALALRKSDVRQTQGNGWILMVEGKERSNGQRETKTKRSRSVLIANDMLPIVLDAIEKISTLKKESAIQAIVARAGLKANLKISAHDLRRFAAQRLLRKNVPLHLIQNFLGHSNMMTTTRYLRMSVGEEEMKATMMSI